ncbi:MAG TPA: hypothetical protein VL945_01990 [Candidatus Saccharimonadales bacterium]|nr:hypothetical protein [Candidatus Saccharimonadales bacterium]
MGSVKLHGADAFKTTTEERKAKTTLARYVGKASDLIKNYKFVTSNLTTRQKARTPIKIAKATTTVLKVTEYYAKITGVGTPAPKINLIESNKYCGFFQYNKPMEITLNSKIGLTPGTIAHEMVHKDRHETVDRQQFSTPQGTATIRTHLQGHYKTTDIITTNEACATFGDAAFVTKDIGNKEERKKKIIETLRNIYSHETSAVKAALLIVDMFEKQQKTGKQQQGLHPLMSNIKEALCDANTAIPKGQPGDAIKPSSEHIIGAGLALILFTANNYDAEKTLKEALTQDLSRIQWHAGTAIGDSLDGGNWLRKELKEQGE